MRRRLRLEPGTGNPLAVPGMSQHRERAGAEIPSFFGRRGSRPDGIERDERIPRQLPQQLRPRRFEPHLQGNRRDGKPGVDEIGSIEEIVESHAAAVERCPHGGERARPDLFDWHQGA